MEFIIVILLVYIALAAFVGVVEASEGAAVLLFCAGVVYGAYALLGATFAVLLVVVCIGPFAIAYVIKR
jgi:hypothetical protein